jgi:hypothetical protein
MIRLILLVLIVFSLTIFVGCNSCECNEGNGLEGFYVCGRRATNDKELLWLFKDKTYLHILSYDNVEYVNSDVWRIEKDPDKKTDIFKAENWIRPCSFENPQCYDKMEIITKNNFNEYKGSKAQLDFGCYKGLDDTCFFRLMDSQEPMYNYKRVGAENKELKLGLKKMEFYSDRDSFMFCEIIRKHNIISLK